MNINDILATENRSSERGAPMGATDNFDPEYPNLYVQRVMLEDGDYAADGTYWGGGGSPLYCGFNEQSRVYARAKNRKAAIQLILEDYPEAVIADGLDVVDITNAFVECMCWAESGDPEAMLGDNAGPELLADSQFEKCQELVTDFINYCAQVGIDMLHSLDEQQIGHDLWLTMQGHGAGFWDRGLGKLGDDLTKAAKAFHMDVYLGDDELIYVS